MVGVVHIKDLIKHVRSGKEEIEIKVKEDIKEETEKFVNAPIVNGYYLFI